MNNKEAREAILGGERLPMPDNCPKEVYDLLLKCWHSEPDKRLDFPIILNKIQVIYNSLYESNDKPHFEEDLSSKQEIIYETTN